MKIQAIETFLGIELNLEAIHKYPPKPWRRAPVFETDGNIGYI